MSLECCCKAGAMAAAQLEQAVLSGTALCRCRPHQISPHLKLAGQVFCRHEMKSRQLQFAPVLSQRRGLLLGSCSVPAGLPPGMVTSYC